MKHFTAEEVAGLDPRLVEMLGEARETAGVPFRITSGLRTAEENQRVGGVFDSAHTRGLAVDLACFDSRSRMLMVRALLLAGFGRVGLYERHVHVDCDESLPRDVMWLDRKT
jgi:uncharacterized protein YcbK (DUF882 family)